MQKSICPIIPKCYHLNCEDTVIHSGHSLVQLQGLSFTKKKIINAIGSETIDMEGGCWPQRTKLVYIIYWCNFLSHCLLGRKKIHFPQIHSDGLKYKFIQFIKSCYIVGKNPTHYFIAFFFFQHGVMETLIA